MNCLNRLPEFGELVCVVALLTTYRRCPIQIRRWLYIGGRRRWIIVPNTRPRLDFRRIVWPIRANRRLSKQSRRRDNAMRRRRSEFDVFWPSCRHCRRRRRRRNDTRIANDERFLRAGKRSRSLRHGNAATIRTTRPILRRVFSAVALTTPRAVGILLPFRISRRRLSRLVRQRGRANANRRDVSLSLRQRRRSSHATRTPSRRASSVASMGTRLSSTLIVDNRMIQTRRALVLVRRVKPFGIGRWTSSRLRRRRRFARSSGGPFAFRAATSRRFWRSVILSCSSSLCYSSRRRSRFAGRVVPSGAVR